MQNRMQRTLKGASAILNIYHTVTMATLKISDLSVGDWVICNGFKATIAGYNAESGSIQVLTKQKNKMWFGLDDIEPIPITAEILDKNGFKCFCEDADTTLYGTPLCSIFHTKGTLRYKLYTPPASVVCWNIHQLQHALRLAGVDKEINL